MTLFVKKYRFNMKEALLLILIFGTFVTANAQRSYNIHHSGLNSAVSSNKRYQNGYVSFLIPLGGLIWYFLWRKDTPNKAKSVLIAAIIGFIAGLILRIL